MAKRRRSREFKNSSQVIDIEEARRKRLEKRRKHRGRIQHIEVSSPKSSTRRSVKSNKLRRMAIYAAIIIIIAGVIGASAYNIISLKQEQKILTAQQKALKDKKQELKEELNHLNDPDYIEEQARAQLRLVMPGESIYVFPEEAE